MNKKISIIVIICGSILFFLGMIAFACLIPPPQSSGEFLSQNSLILVGLITGLGLVLLILGIAMFWNVWKKEHCTCPKTCDCQNPPPDDPEEYEKGGPWHVSNYCPVHNDYPDPDPDCPVHGHEA